MVVAENNGSGIGSCKVEYDYDSICISSWFVDKEYQHMGIGKNLIKKALESIPIQFTNVKYIWNGQNKYVLEWLEKHFKAKNICPINILKYSDNDSWDSHIYVLDKDLFIKYFKEVQVEV